ncbi:glycosyltransferase [uncultured Devosia sp.]|uniref:glycosyltransferase n=1 Tax=uncultured Devosia sp. TaxID=211434 RepID=UPI0035CC8553
MTEMTNSLCRTAPDLLREHGIEAIVTDQLEPAGALVADHLGLPYVSLAAAHPINREPLIPLGVLPWPYEDSPKAIERNRVGTWIADKLTARHDRAVSEWSVRWGLPSRSKVVDCLSPIADICQLVPGFDFPRRELPPSFHYVGPLRAPGEREQTSARDGDPRPLVFATLGTLQGHRVGLFRRIAKACRQAGVRLVVSHANCLTDKQAATIDAHLVLPWVDQGELLSKADAVITNGGLNTVLEALSAGLPILCLPIAFEQPGIGARLERSGAGKVVSPKSSSRQIAMGLQEILHSKSYRQHAQQLAGELRTSGGCSAAAQIVDQALARASTNSLP